VTADPQARLRIYFDAETMLGSGKADFLQDIQETGSIPAAGRRMGMSYKRAWTLIDTFNHYFCQPLVISAAGGGISLTPLGISEPPTRLKQDPRSPGPYGLLLLP
jgi:molybdate transport system regulatory protein